MKTRWIDLPFGVRLYLRYDAEEAMDVLRDIQTKLKDPRPVFRKTANIMRRSFAANFAEGGRPDPWAPLALSTRYQKRRSPYATFRYKPNRARFRRLYQQGQPSQRTSRNILILSGRLRDSYVQKNADHVENISKDRLEIGSKHWLAPIHEYGTKPYNIYPKRARFLRIPVPGGFIFRAMVRHPGLAARPVALVQAEDIEAIQEVALAWIRD
jgi:phage gpG-like protein